MRQVCFYGSLPKEGESPYGGGEVGNMRTIRMLEEAGYSVVKIRKIKTPSSYSIFRRNLSYPYRLIEGWIKTICTLLFRSRKTIFHLSGFAGVTIMNEFVLMHIVKMLGFKAIYELRGGGAVSFYENGSALYRLMFRYLLRHSDCIFSQGKENIPMINSLASTPVYHYANCVDNGFAPTKKPQKPNDKINILFYGRLEEAKHVDLIVDVAAELQVKLPNVNLTILGNGTKEYIDFIRDAMESKLVKGSYELLPGCAHDELKPIFEDKHFYIFPSTQIREGQSNAVTEVMSYGIIPIASPQGFNRSTIGYDELIVENMDPQRYSDVILKIIRDNSFQYYSDLMYKRYRENYSQSIVFEKTLRVYDSIFNQLESNGKQ